MELTELRETARLARVSMSEGELRAMFPAFEEMLSFFALMQTAGEDMSVTANGVTVDCICHDYAGISNETLLSNAGECQGRFVTVPHVLPEHI